LPVRAAASTAEAKIKAALQKGDIGPLREMLETDPSLVYSRFNESKEPALLFTVRNGIDQEKIAPLVDLLLKNGARPDHSEAREPGQTALHEACHRNFQEIAVVLSLRLITWATHMLPVPSRFSE
jgi:hypothetical protein